MPRPRVTPSNHGDQAEPRYAQTRKSLIERLGDWEDHRSWDEFYQTYWRLIHSTAVKAGLTQEEAFDVVQETVLGIAKQSREGRYDPTLGSFKAWLLNITRWRIGDQFRKRARNPATPTAGPVPTDGSAPDTDWIERLEDPKAAALERHWEAEWQQSLGMAAMKRVKSRVSHRQFQIYECHVLQGWPVAETARRLGINSAQVYLAKHRVGALVKKEIRALENTLL